MQNLHFTMNYMYMYYGRTLEVIVFRLDAQLRRAGLICLCI